MARIRLVETHPPKEGPEATELRVSVVVAVGVFIQRHRPRGGEEEGGILAASSSRHRARMVAPMAKRRRWEGNGEEALKEEIERGEPAIGGASEGATLLWI